MQAEDRRKQSNSPRDTATARHVRPKDKGELLTITNTIQAVKQPQYEGGVVLIMTSCIIYQVLEELDLSFVGCYSTTGTRVCRNLLP
jgi:hypothetical protein